MPSVGAPQKTATQMAIEEPVVAVSVETYETPEALFDTVWRFFCSTRLALILIMLIAAATLAGTMLLQAPEGVASDPSEYLQWLPRARLKYGPFTDILSMLQLFDIYNTVWFRALLALLTINTTVCTVNRWKGLWRSINGPRIRMGDGFFRKASRSVTLTAGSMPPSQVAEAVKGALTRHRYRVLTEHEAGNVYFYADKNRYGKLGTFLSHMSLVLILAAAVFGSLVGFRDKDFIVPVGSDRAIGHGTKLTLHVDQFIDEYYPEGPPKDYRTDAVLYDDGLEVGRHTIRVNDPMEYQGIRFYQSFFGPAAVVRVKDADGNVLYDDGVGMAYRTRDDRPAGIVTLPEKGIEINFIAPVSGKTDPQIPAGQLQVRVYQFGTNAPLGMDNLITGKPKRVGDYEYTFVRELQFTGLQVAKDPGAGIIWFASAMLVIGLASVFYFPHRRIWIASRPDGKQGSKVVVAATGRHNMGLDEEFRRVVAALQTGTGFAS